MVALSDSSVTSGSSGATVSPGATWISMTGTSAKFPMSGIWTSMSAMTFLKEKPARVFENVAQVPGESGRERAVDDAVVVGEG